MNESGEPQAVLVAGYTRKSTDEPDKQVYSLDSQVSAIKDACQTKGWELVEVYTDDGISGTIFDRPQLRRMRRDAKAGKFNMVLAVNFDRIARDNADSSYVRKELAGWGVKMAETSAPEMDSGSATGKLVYGVKGVVAEFEHDMISERTKRAMQYAKSKGKHMGRPPSGYEIGMGGRLIPTDQARMVHSMLQDAPTISPMVVGAQFGLTYKRAWDLLSSVRKHGVKASDDPVSEPEP